jgi:hypothetical protein
MGQGLTEAPHTYVQLKDLSRGPIPEPDPNVLCERRGDKDWLRIVSSVYTYIAHERRHISPTPNENNGVKKKEVRGHVPLVPRAPCRYLCAS